MARRRVLRLGGGINSGELQLLGLWCTKNGSGFIQWHHYGKAILSYSPLAVEAVYAELAMAAHLALLLGLVCGGSQGPLASKVGERRQASPPESRQLLQLLRKTVKLDGHGTLGFRCLRLKIGMILWAIERGFGTIS
jgi:hypothetical protein